MPYTILALKILAGMLLYAAAMPFIIRYAVSNLVLRETLHSIQRDILSILGGLVGCAFLVALVVDIFKMLFK